MTMAVIGLAGCGSSSEATVEGLVTLDGNPVPGGMIAFVPTVAGAQAYAISDESGNYEVYTGREPGLRPGDYVVTIVAQSAPKIAKTELGGPPPAGEAITPAWYGSIESSTLKFEVEPGANDINLELTSPPPAGLQIPAQARK